MTALESPLSNRMDDKFGLQNNGVSRLEAPTQDEDILGSSIDCSAKLQRSGLTETEDPNGTISGDSNCTMSSECDITVIHVPGAHAANDRMITKDAEDDGGIPIADNDKKDYGLEGKDSKDGSDSGVEGCAVELPRVQSRNSVDYASSSCNGLDEASCDSSLVSCCSVYEDTCATLPDDPRLGQGHGALGGPPGGGEGTSEGGSESSSIAGSVSARVQKRANNNPSCAQAKKKIGGTHGLTETQRSGNQRSGKGVIPASGGATVNGTTSTGARAKPRATPQRNLPTKPQVNNCRESSRGRSRDKSLAKEPRDGSGPRSGSRCASAARVTNGSVGSTVASRARARPDTLPSALTTEINKDLAQRSKATGGTRARGGTTNRTTATATATTSTSTSTSTGRTPGSTPSEDGRKPPPSTARNTASLCTSRVDPRSSRMLDKMSSSTEGSKTLDAYATLPRAPRHGRFTAPKTNEKPPVAGRSRSGSRDASLNRILGRKGVTNKEAISHKGLPPYPKYKVTEKTRIYHETSVQTGLTCKDIDNCLAGIATIIPNPESVEMSEKDSQTEGTWDDLQEMKENLKKTTSENEERKKDNEKLKIEVDELKKKLAEEQADHIFARQELDRNSQRVLAMLGTPQSEHAEASDSFLELESHFQSSGQVVANQQIEIADLQSLCRMLSRDLEKSLAAQKALLQQQQELEAESMEMQDFLQEEKTTLEIALKEAEIELKKKDENGKQLSSELERQTEECKHLVRISEQRRQENLSLCMKLNAVERRSKDLLLAQGAASSGASVALSGLGNRLEGLIDQLIMSYNISEKDFEDVVYHNEAYSRSNSSVESSPVSSKHSLKDCTPSPKRGSFVSAVIGAIKNAANHPFTTKQTNEKKFSDSSKLMRKDLSTESSSDILDFETEPCLMMESVLEDVPLTDTYSHNMVSSCDSLRRVLSVPETVDEFNFKNMKVKGESSSLTNLTQAILNRRKVEDEEEENCESISESETGPSESLLALGDYCQASLVDQVIDVDNLVTKLLKVLRIIQLDNDTCIQELKDDKLELETRLEIFLAERKTVVNSQDCETKISSNGVNSQTSIIENCIHVIKGINNAKELIIGGQIERKKCILNEYQDDDHNANAAVLFS